MNIPEEPREDDSEKMNKKITHEHNKKEAQETRAHENQNPNLGKGHNPIHHDQGNR